MSFTFILSPISIQLPFLLKSKMSYKLCYLSTVYISVCVFHHEFSLDEYYVDGGIKRKDECGDNNNNNRNTYNETLMYVRKQLVYFSDLLLPL